MKKNSFKILVFIFAFGWNFYSDKGQSSPEDSSSDYGENYQKESIYLEWLLKADEHIEVLRDKYEKMLLKMNYIFFVVGFPTGYELQMLKTPYGELKEALEDAGEKITRFKHQLYETLEVYTTCKSLLKKSVKNFILENNYRYITISEFYEKDYPEPCIHFAKEAYHLRNTSLSELNTSIKLLAKENESLGYNYRFPVKKMAKLKNIVHELAGSLQIELSP